jgi:hypothetical protein
MRLFKRKTVKKGDLRNLNVELVSLLFDDVTPANRKGAVVKSNDGKHKYAPIAGSKKFKSTEQGRLYVTVLEPDTLDSQGDKISKSEIVEAMDHFVTKGMIGRNDVNHNMNPVEDFVVVENYILKQQDKEHFPDTKVGSWVQCIKCTDLESELWHKIRKGNFNGVSIYGTAEDVQTKTDNKELIDELKSLRETFQKADNKEAIKQIDDKIKKLEKGEPADFTEIVKAIEKMSKTINKAINKAAQDEPGEDEKMDKEVIIKGEKVVIKQYHRDIVEKAFGQNGDPEKMNLLVGNTSAEFIDETLETKDDDTLNEITVTEMSKDNSIDVGLIQDLVLKNSLDGSPTAQEVSESDLDITPYVLAGEVKVARSTVEFYKDKYGEEAFLAYMLKKLGNKALLAIKKLLFKGDRDSGTATLAGMNGVLALAIDSDDVTSIDTGTYETWKTRLEQAILQFDDEVLEHSEDFRIYVSHKDLIRIRGEAQLSKNATDSRLTVDGRKVYFDGIEIKGRYMTSNYVIAGLPKFIIAGVRTDAEVFRKFIPWYWHWYIRLRAGITYVTGFVKVFKIEAVGS